MKKKKPQPKEPRSLLIRDLVTRPVLNGGRMRDRRKRRSKDARRDPIRAEQE